MQTIRLQGKKRNRDANADAVRVAAAVCSNANE